MSFQQPLVAPMAIEVSQKDPGMYGRLMGWGNQMGTWGNQMGNQMGTWGNQMGNQMGAWGNQMGEWGSRNKHSILKAFYIFMAVIAIAGSVLNMLYNNYPTSIGVTAETTQATKDGWVIGTTIGVCAGVGIATLLAAFGIDSNSRDEGE